MPVRGIWFLRGRSGLDQLTTLGEPISPVRLPLISSTPAYTSRSTLCSSVFPPVRPRNDCAGALVYPERRSGRSRPCPLGLLFSGANERYSGRGNFSLLGRTKSLRRCQLRRQLIHGGDVIKVGEIGVASESLALFAIYQDSHLQDAGRVRRNGVNERGDGEIFHENSRAVTVGESSIEVDDGDSGIDEEYAPHFGAKRERVRRRLFEIQREQGAEQ